MNGTPEACGNCRFFHSGGNADFCRRHAPVPLALGLRPNPITKQVEPLVDSYFPVTGASLWCGEYERGTAPFRPSPKPILTADQVAEALARAETEGTA